MPWARCVGDPSRAAADEPKSFGGGPKRAGQVALNVRPLLTELDGPHHHHPTRGVGGSRLGHVAWAKDGVQHWSGKRSVKAIECTLRPSAAISTGPETVELQLKKASDVGKCEGYNSGSDGNGVMAEHRCPYSPQCLLLSARSSDPTRITRNFAPRQGAWGAGLRPHERAPDKLGQSPLFLRWTALDSKRESFEVTFLFTLSAQ